MLGFDQQKVIKLIHCTHTASLLSSATLVALVLLAIPFAIGPRLRYLLSILNAAAQRIVHQEGLVGRAILELEYEDIAACLALDNVVKTHRSASFRLEEPSV